VSRAGTATSLLAVVAFESAYLTAALRAPWSGLTLAALAAALIAVGFAAGLPGLLLATAATAAPMFVWYLPSDGDGWDGALSSGACDPSCGISLLGALLVVLPIILALAGVGVAVRGLRRWVQMR
jgi:hypothetical protein